MRIVLEKWLIVVDVPKNVSTSRTMPSSTLSWIDSFTVKKQKQGRNWPGMQVREPNQEAAMKQENIWAKKESIHEFGIVFECIFFFVI